VSTAPANDPLVGRVIADKYQLEAVAGTGATGTVYRARHVELGRPLAVKVLAPHLVDNPTAQARFRREARAASKLEHPNSVQVLDFGIESDGTTYLAMEFLEGRELFKAIYEEWPLGAARTAKIMGQVLSVLAAAHDLGIVHRDLKPENVMLVTRISEDGEPREIVKVADFGIAKSVSGTASEDSLNLTRDGTVHGTPEYMSPEQARGEELDGRADLYACGVMLYEMMTGTLPFAAESAFEVILKHLSDRVEPPTKRRPDCDPRLEPVVLRALAKKRDERYQDAREMRAALLDAVRGDDGVPISLTRATPKTGVSVAHVPAPLAKMGLGLVPHADHTAAIPLAKKAGLHLATEEMDAIVSPVAVSPSTQSEGKLRLPTNGVPWGVVLLVIALVILAVLSGAYLAGAFDSHPAHTP
jgi:serine/threonine-protein kinase